MSGVTLLYVIFGMRVLLFFTAFLADDNNLCVTVFVIVSGACFAWNDRSVLEYSVSCENDLYSFELFDVALLPPVTFIDSHGTDCR